MTLPRGLKIPAMLQALEFSIRPYGLLRRAARLHGDPFTMRIIGKRNYVMLSAPSAVREVFGGFNGSEHLRIGNDELRPGLGDHSLLLLDGAEHKRHRKILQPPFSAASVYHYGSLIESITERLSGTWGPVVPVYESMREIALEIILSVVLGLKPGARMEEFKTRVEKFIDAVSGPVAYIPFLQKDLGAWSPGGRFFRAKKSLDALVNEEIAARRAGSGADAEGVLFFLLTAADEEGRTFSDEEIHGELLTLILAGHDPTTAALAWAMHWVHADASVEERLRAELSATRDPDECEYLEAVCNETLRICPMFPMVERKMMVSVDVAGHEIEPGARIAPCVYLTHHRPELFDEPERFKPERFLGRRFSASEFYPFGGGARRCIGASFALYQLKVILASVLRRFKFEPLERRRVRPVLRGASIAPSGRLKMRATPIPPAAV
jgi:cytochrome P450 family 110